MKKCNKCGLDKALDDFSKRPRATDGHRNTCKVCMASYYKAYCSKNAPTIKMKTKAYRTANAEAIKAHKKQYYQKNRAEVDERNKQWRLDHLEQSRANVAAQMRRFREDHHEEYNADRNTKRNLRRKTDECFRVEDNLRRRINIAMRRSDTYKSAHTMELIGCTVPELKAHLESLFTDGMSWKNYGYNGWHVDHVRPVSSFDLSDPIQQKLCFNYTNLQPLWATDNLKKGCKW